MIRTKASVLVGLLWCLVLLSVVVIGVLHTARLDLLVVKNYGDQIQAHYLALAGLEKAKALLYHDAAARKRSAQNHSGALYDAPEHFRDVPLGRGQFRVFRQGRREEGGQVIYGVTDEESRLNINHASAQQFGNLYGMRPEMIAAILDWRDANNMVTPGGAESDYYASLKPPYLPRNGPLQTTRELFMVAGVPRELIVGEDTNQNGLLDREEDDGNNSDPPDNRDGVLDAGWSGALTSDSSVRNQNAAGRERINIQSADEAALTSVPGISAELAKAIVAHRGQNALESLADLLDVTAVNPQGQQRPQEGPGANQPVPPGPTPSRISPSAGAARSQPSGPKLVSQTLLMDIADELAINAQTDQPGAINVNTASAAVLASLPGVDQELAEAIVSYRQSAGFLPNIAWLLKVPGMTQPTFKRLAPLVSARSETFRIVSEGSITSSGTRKRLQEIVHIDASDIKTLSFREDL